MTSHPTTGKPISSQLRERLRETLKQSVSEGALPKDGPATNPLKPETSGSGHFDRLRQRVRVLEKKGAPQTPTPCDPPSPGVRAAGDLETSAALSENSPGPIKKTHAKTDLDGTLAGRHPARGEVSGPKGPTEPSAISTEPAQNLTGYHQDNMTLMEDSFAGGSMQDLSGYKDLSKPPMMGDEEDKDDSRSPIATTLSPSIGFDRPVLSPDYHSDPHPEVDTEFSSNVRTLIRLVSDLPEGVTKQTGAQIIRLTMEAMGISMEDVLTEAQSAQSEMLDAVRANIKKIEEYKTVIRKLESDIKYYQGKANELSEIIDLFILSNTSPKVPNVDELTD